MLIKSIELCNFRQFLGRQTINCSIDPAQPITVVLSPNTGGKTTVVRSLSWCLYGGSAESLGFEKSSSLLNDVLLEDLQNNSSDQETQKRMYVTLKVLKPAVVSENGSDELNPAITYTFTRSIVYKRNAGNNENIIQYEDFRVFEKIGDKNENEISFKSDQHKIVDSFMPQELSDCFFFWGERVKSITSNANLAEAVNRFTGVYLYTRLIDHLKDVIRSWDDGFIEHSSNILVKKLGNEKRDLEQHRDQLLEMINSVERSINDYTNAKEKEEENLIKYHETQTNGARLKDLMEESKKCKKLLEENQSLFAKKFNSASFPRYFVLKRAEKLINDLTLDESNTAGWGNVTIDTIKEILEKGICVCGTRIKDHPDLIEHLEKQMPYVVPNALGNYLGIVKSNMT